MAAAPRRSRTTAEPSPTAASRCAIVPRVASGPGPSGTVRRRRRAMRDAQAVRSRSSSARRSCAACSGAVGASASGQRSARRRRSGSSSSGSRRRSSRATTPRSTRATTRTRGSTSRCCSAARTSTRSRPSPPASAEHRARPGCRACSRSREGGTDLVVIAQIFQRSGTRRSSFKDKNITKPADFEGKKVGVVARRQRARAVRGDDEGGPRPGQGERSSSRTSTWTACSTATSMSPRP